MPFCAGIDVLLSSPGKMDYLGNSRTGLVAHPASVTAGNVPSLDALIRAGIGIQRVFGPQHGMRGEKQDNMIESSDYVDPVHGIPVISLYGEHRYPTREMLADLDVVLFDLQDIGCRIYTYITTLKYFIEACARHECELWVLDRPNPAGRPVDGLILVPGEESFVGCDELPTRHGLTTGELATWFNSRQGNPAALEVIRMQDYSPELPPGYGWPLRPWINPSPNAASLNMARCFPGTVLLEGTVLSEGRGTTIPLEVIGAPGLPVTDMLDQVRRIAPHWLEGVYLRPCYFEPTFHKHAGRICTGIQIHTDFTLYDHQHFKPFRLIAGLLKALRMVIPGYDLWRCHDYEYEQGRLPIDVINGGPGLRIWIDEEKPGFDDLELRLRRDEERWMNERDAYVFYR